MNLIKTNDIGIFRNVISFCDERNFEYVLSNWGVPIKTIRYDQSYNKITF